MHLDRKKAVEFAAEVRDAGLGLTTEIVNGAKWESSAILITDHAGHWESSDMSKIYVCATDEDVELTRSSIENQQANLDLPSTNVNQVYARMTDNEKHGISFALFPAWVGEYDLSTDETVALMDLHKRRMANDGV